MEYAVLGRTGLRVSRVGCGGGGIGQVWGPTTEVESVRTIHRALELGVNFFDVAPGYGHGKAEEVLGRALHGRQEPVVIATRCGWRQRRCTMWPAPSARLSRRAYGGCAGRWLTCCTSTTASHHGVATYPIRSPPTMPWAQCWMPTARCNTRGRRASLAYRPWNRMCQPYGAS